MQLGCFVTMEVIPSLSTCLGNQSSCPFAKEACAYGWSVPGILCMLVTHWCCIPSIAGSRGHGRMKTRDSSSCVVPDLVYTTARFMPEGGKGKLAAKAGS